MRYKRMRMLAIGVAATLSMTLLCACGKEQNIDYTIEGMTETEQPQNDGGKSGLSQFDGEVWEENWTVRTGETEWEGQTVDVVTNIVVDAEIVVPKAEQMSVIEVKEPEFDEEYKETIAERIFESDDFYYENGYIGSYAGREYRLSFVEEPGDEVFIRSIKQIFMAPTNLYEVCPDKYKNVEDLICSAWMLGNYVENQCQISEADALKEAEEFVEKLGLNYSVVSTTRPLVWGVPPEVISITDGLDSEDWGIDGYVFSFDLGVDGISFVDYGMEEDYADFWSKTERKEEVQYSMQARLQVYVTDKGVIQMVANNPVEIIGVSEGVELLPLDTVKGIIKEALKEQWEAFRFDDVEKYYDGMELIYFRVRDKENPGKYSYVPTWRLGSVTRDTIQHLISIKDPVLINAIDGSVIDFYNET